MTERPYDDAAERSLRDAGRGHLSRHGGPPYTSIDRADDERKRAKEDILYANEQLTIEDELESWPQFFARLLREMVLGKGQAR